MRSELGVRGFKATAARADGPGGPSGPQTLLCLIPTSITPTHLSRPFNWPALHCFQVCGSTCGKYIVRCLEKGDKHESFSLLLIHWRHVESQSDFFALIYAELLSGEEKTDTMKGDTKLHLSTSVVLKLLRTLIVVSGWKVTENLDERNV